MCKPWLHIWWTPHLFRPDLICLRILLFIFVSFTVSVHTSIPKRPPPSLFPLFIPSLTTLYHSITSCPSLRSPGCNRSRTLLHMLLPKPPNPVTSVILLHWLKITEHIEYKLLSLTYKVLATTLPSYLHNLITVQPHRSTRSSSLVTRLSIYIVLALWITGDRSFQYACPRLWNQLPASVHQPHTNLSNSDLPCPTSGTSPIGSIDSSLSSSITPSLFHSRIKTFIFCKSFPLYPSFPSSGLTAWIPRTVTDTSEHIRFYFLLLFFYILVFGSMQ